MIATRRRRPDGRSMMCSGGGLQRLLDSQFMLVFEFVGLNSGKLEQTPPCGNARASQIHIRSICSLRAQLSIHKTEVETPTSLAHYHQDFFVGSQGERLSANNKSRT